MANHFGIGIAGNLTREERARYHIAGLDEIIAAVERQIPGLVVLGGWMYDVNNALSNEAPLRLNTGLRQRYGLVSTQDGLGFCRPLHREEP